MRLHKQVPCPRCGRNRAKQKKAGLVDCTFECHPAAQLDEALKTLLIEYGIGCPHQLCHVVLSSHSPIYLHFTATTHRMWFWRGSSEMCERTSCGPRAWDRIRRR